MTKIRKQKRLKRFRANVNRKRLRNKLQKLPKIECDEIENSWEQKRSIRTNLKDMGLAYDPNEVLKIASTKEGINKGRKKNVIEKDKDFDNGGTTEKTSTNNITFEKIHVANKLEEDAKAPRERLFRLPKSQVHFITYLMEKYGDDYKAMARDRKNYYQMTWCQIRAKINKFKSIPEQYAEYLLKSGEIVLEDPTPLEETWRKLGEENAKKHCTPKKRKVSENPKKSMWEVESIENDDDLNIISEEKNLKTSDSQDKNKTEDSNELKKLKLFSDEELGDNENLENNKINRKMNRKSLNLKEDHRELKSKELIAKNKKIHENSLSSKLEQKIDTRSKKIDNPNNDLNKTSKKLKLIEKSQSSDSDTEGEEFEGDDDADGFVNLSDMSEEELSEDDVLDDGELVTDYSD